MSSQSQPPTSTPAPPAAPTDITGLGDDLLREIFLRLPSLPSLVRAAFACRAFRRAVCSSPAFRRSFRALHAPPLLTFFLDSSFEVVPIFPCPWRRCDPDLGAADFFGVGVSRHDDARATGWEILPSYDGYLALKKVSRSTNWVVSYRPLTQALDLFLYKPGNSIDLEFYTLSSEDGQGPSRVVCVRHHFNRRGQVAVFSSNTMAWQIFPRNTLLLREGASSGTVMRGLIWWPKWMYQKIVVLDTSTFQFSLIDVPTPLMTQSDESSYKLGETKDEKLCFVDIKDDTLYAYFRTAGDDGVVERWMLYKKFPLHTVVKNVTGCSMEEEGCPVNAEIVAVIDGFVYLSIFYCKDTQLRDLCLSLCLETSEISELFNDAHEYHEEVHPYVMAWPPSLLQSKEESETEFTGDSTTHNDPMCTEKATSVLVAALQSLSQALVDDGGSNIEILTELHAFLLDSNKETVAELNAFLILRPNEDDKGSKKEVVIKGKINDSVDK
ncbi:hypothetical protein ACQ4PT_024304 [Festuca glaucescens]